MVCGIDLCSEEAPCFNITDFDSDNDTFPVDAIATVTIEGVKDIDIANRNIVTNEKIVFSDNSRGKRFSMNDTICMVIL